HRHRQFQHVHRQVATGVDVGGGQAPPDEQTDVLRHVVGDGADVAAFRLAHCRDADLQFAYADLRQRGGDGTFFGAAEGDPGGLFAVAQGGVVDGDGGV